MPKRAKGERIIFYIFVCIICLECLCVSVCVISIHSLMAQTHESCNIYEMLALSFTHKSKREMRKIPNVKKNPPLKRRATRRIRVPLNGVKIVFIYEKKFSSRCYMVALHNEIRALKELSRMK